QSPQGASRTRDRAGSVSAHGGNHLRLRHLRARSRGADPQLESWRRAAEGLLPQRYRRKSFEVFYPKGAIDRRFPAYELEIAARDGRFEDEGWRIRKDGS